MGVWQELGGRCEFWSRCYVGWLSGVDLDSYWIFPVEPCFSWFFGKWGLSMSPDMLTGES